MSEETVTRYTNARMAATATSAATWAALARPVR